MKRLLLVGAGHAHAQVLQDWIGKPVPGTELTLVSPSALAPYSGMVPGWLAGHYRVDEICIDFERLARAAGVRFVQAEVVAIDAAQRRVTLDDNRHFDYDMLSLNIGSTLSPPDGDGVLSLRPLGKLHDAWEAWLAEFAKRDDQDAPLRVTAVGGGAAGVESLLAVLVRLRALQPRRRIDGQLVTRSDVLLPDMAPGAVRAASRALRAAGVELRLGTDFGPDIAAATDLLLWATGAEAHGWPRDSALACSELGFVRIDEHLRSVSHPEVFAVGDCADWSGADGPLPKAGVFAVRMGPVLAHNLRAALTDQPLQSHRPRRRFLALLASADRRAIAAWNGWSAAGPWLGRWLWRWKDGIDRGFLRRFETAPATTAEVDARIKR